MSESILSLIIALPIVGAIVIGLMRSRESDDAEADRFNAVAVGFSAITLVLGIVALVMFFQATTTDGSAEIGSYALVAKYSWINDSMATGESANLARYLDIQYHVGVDGLSVWLLLLTAFLVPLSLWASKSGIRTRAREFYVLMLLLEAGMLGVFCSRDLLLFYIFFEFTLIPMFFLIAVWGGAQRREACIRFFLYTMAGSMLTFAAVLYMAYQAYVLPVGQGGVGRFTFDIETLYNLQLSDTKQWWLFLAFAIGFAVKVPLFPLHTWLPLAHTEAPTPGSVILAGILLKLGSYGLLRFCIPMLPEGTLAFAPLMGTLAVISIIYASLVAWVQVDVKKLVAYSSVAHMGFCILGMFSLKMAGLSGSMLYMVSHGLSTGALFLVVGMIYERYHTRRSDEIGGLARRMPWLAFFLIFFTLTSIGLPGLNGFVSEFLVLLGAFTSASTVDNLPAGPLGTTYAILAAIGVILGAIYMLAMCQRVLFGPLIEPAGTPDTSNGLAEDLTKREIGVLVPIAALCLFIGVYPKPILDTMHAAAGKQIMANFYMHQADDADLDKSVVQSPFESLEDSATASVVSAFDSDHQTAAREVTP